MTRQQQDLSSNVEISYDGNEQKKRKLECGVLGTQYILGLFALAYAGAFAIGGLLLFLYLLRYQFNPGGLSASDTLSMAICAFGFVATFLLIHVLATFAGYPIAWLGHLVFNAVARGLRWADRKNRIPQGRFWWGVAYGSPRRLERSANQWWWLFVGVILLCSLVPFWEVSPPELRKFLVSVLIIGCGISLFLFGYWVESYEPFPRRKFASHPFEVWFRGLALTKQALIVSSCVAACNSLISFGIWHDLSMIAIGFREQDVNVRLDKNDFQELIERAARIGIAVNPCEQIGPTSSVVEHADIIWQNLGMKSLIRFPSKNIWGDDDPKGRTVRLESNKSISSVGKSQLRCSEFLTENLFKDRDGELRHSAVVSLTDQLTWLRRIPSGSAVRVVAHENPSTSDAQISDGANVTSLRQANVLKAFLQAEFKLPSSMIQTIGAGAAVPKQECVGRIGTQRLLCERTNRRVEVFEFDPD